MKEENSIIDWKYKFVATNPCSGSVHTEKDAIVFLAKDAAVPAMLKAYLAECVRLGCDELHREAVQLLFKRVVSYQNKSKREVPDTNTACEIDRCIGGKV